MAWLINALLIIAALFIGVQLVTLLTNLIFFPVLKPSETVSKERISILVPARNEAKTLPKNLPRLLMQKGNFEVVVLNDQSTDGTAEVLETFRTNPKFRFIQGEPLSVGWSGKNWACHQLVQAAQGEILIFTDADVRWEPSTLTSLLAFRAKHAAEFVSVWPRQLTGSLLERITVPAIDLILLGSLPYLGVKYLPFGAFSAGNGQLMLFTKEAYETLGGHAAFKSEVLEDVRMGQAAKGLDIPTALALGGEVLSTRMYETDEALLEGFSKNILAATGHNRGFLIVLGILNTLTYGLSWLLGFIHPWWFVIATLGLAQRALTSLKTGRSPLEALLQPLMPIPFWRISLRVLRRKGAYTWKGRDYA